jgi:glycosyltransferase involved in cell wall biosynthesis
MTTTADESRRRATGPDAGGLSRSQTGRRRIAIDDRLRAYRCGGIATHVACLLDGLADLQPAERFVVLQHRRQACEPDRRPAKKRAPVGQDPCCGPHARLTRRRVLTPPHHRLEGWLLPLELLGAGVDLLHATDFVLPRLWRGRGVVTVHDLAFLRRPELLTADSLRYYRQVGASVHRAERIIAVSEYTRSELVALTDAAPERIRVIPNAVRPDFLQPPNAEAEASCLARYALRAPFILFVSTIEPRKNLGTLLEAYRQLLDGGLQAELAIVGADGWQSGDAYDTARDLGLEHVARFLGFVPLSDLASLYRRAALLAHPAIDEGFGIPPIEAMASGTPVVAADAGALPETVGEAGLLVGPLDVAGWAAALARVLTDPALSAGLADAGRRRAAAFTPRRMAEATLAVYREARMPRSEG